MNNEEFKKKLIIRTFDLSRNVIKLVDKFPNKRSAIPEIDSYLKETDEIVKILGSSIATLKGKNKL